MSKEKKKVIIESVISTVFLGLLVYAAYSLWYIFYGKDSGADVHLYTILSGSALGWFFLLFVDALSKKSNVVLKIIVFLFGNGLFQAVIWGFNKELNPTCTDNEPVVIKSFTVAFVLCAVVALVTFILRTKKGFKALNIILAIIYFVISCGGVLVLNINNIKALEYKKNIQFDRISAEEIAINNKDNKLCEDWYDNNIESEKYPFTFKVDGKEFNPSEWEKDLVKKADVSKKYQGGTTENIVFTNKKTGLKVTLEATSFNKNATCQWVVYIENTGTEKSGIISDFYAYNSKYEYKITNSKLFRRFFALRNYFKSKKENEALVSTTTIKNYKATAKIALELFGEERKLFFITDNISFDDIKSITEAWPVNTLNFFSLNNISYNK